MLERECLDKRVRGRGDICTLFCKPGRSRSLFPLERVQGKVQVSVNIMHQSKGALAIACYPFQDKNAF